MTIETKVIEILFGGLIGLVLGSFAGAWSYRLVRDQDWVFARSRCPACGIVLTMPDLIPIVGFALRRGCCAGCNQPISRRYPIIEAGTAFACALVAAVFGFSPEGLLVFGLTVCLVTLAVSDLETQILPDEAQAGVALSGAIWCYLHQTLISGVAAAGVTVLLGLGLRYYYKRYRNLDALGLGDVKFFGAAGLWLGLGAVFPFLAAASILGLGLAVVLGKGKSDRVPFGVALAAALFGAILIRQLT